MTVAGFRSSKVNKQDVLSKHSNRLKKEDFVSNGQRVNCACTILYLRLPLSLIVRSTYSAGQGLRVLVLSADVGWCQIGLLFFNSGKRKEHNNTAFLQI